MKQYSHNGIPGCVLKSRCGKSGARVAIFNNDQSEYGADSDAPWSVVCIRHNFIADSRSLTVAKEMVSDSREWCDDCQEFLGDLTINEWFTDTYAIRPIRGGDPVGFKWMRSFSLDQMGKHPDGKRVIEAAGVDAVEDGVIRFLSCNTLMRELTGQPPSNVAHYAIVQIVYEWDRWGKISKC